MDGITAALIALAVLLLLSTAVLLFILGALAAVLTGAGILVAWMGKRLIREAGGMNGLTAGTQENRL